MNPRSILPFQLIKTSPNATFFSIRTPHKTHKAMAFTKKEMPQKSRETFVVEIDVLSIQTNGAKKRRFCASKKGHLNLLIARDVKRWTRREGNGWVMSKGPIGNSLMFKGMSQRWKRGRCLGTEKYQWSRDTVKGQKVLEIKAPRYVNFFES